MTLFSPCEIPLKCPLLRYPVICNVIQGAEFLTSPMPLYECFPMSLLNHLDACVFHFPCQSVQHLFAFLDCAVSVINLFYFLNAHTLLQ